MSAPFDSDLTAAPASNAFAWVSNVEGKRDIWVAVPSAGGSGYASRQLTDYASVDGQQIGELAWSPDAKAILYVRGGSEDNTEQVSPNPAHMAGGAEQEVWIVSLADGVSRRAGEGRSPTFSPSGNWVAGFSDGQIMYEKPGDIGSKPPQVFSVFGDCRSFVWSPNGTKLAFISDRDTHGFIGVFSPDTGTLSYVDPGTDHDSFPEWSPDGREIAFVRIPYSKDGDFSGPRRTGRPWSIRVANAATGAGREIWRAEPGRGSVFRELDGDRQLFATADGNLVFPWERDGWLHLYALPLNGGHARLLTPGEFEAESALFSPDRKRVVYSSNQGDSERRHIWQIEAAGGAPAALPMPLTSGDGIETQPVVASDNRTVAVLRSDACIPIRPAVVHALGRMHDLAPQAIPADFPAALLVVPQQVVYSATDGMKIHADLFLPPGGTPCVRHPAVVFVHGGSQRQMQLGWHSMEYYSNAYALNQ